MQGLDTRNADALAAAREGDAARRAGKWAEAVGAYERALTGLPGLAALRLNMAVCLLGLGRHADALRESEAAIGLEDGLWQAHLVRLKALRRLGRADEALQALREAPAVRQLPLEQERVSLTLHELGDAGAASGFAAAARSEFAPLPAEAAADLELNEWIGRLYDPDGRTPDEVNEGFRGWSARHLPAAAPADARPGAPRAGRRLRVGVLSPQFFASPVYFFGIGALRLLSRSADLVFISRGTRRDWASEEFRGIAADWLEAAGLPAPSLAALLRKASLDVLLDMGGWMDRGALQALAGKPARRMFKWVGGQSLTTGLASFDGFLGDRWQSPPETQPLYVEPLVLLSTGYASYSPPPYMPAPRAADPGVVLGVISNPVKVSREFLGFLRSAAGALPGAELRFIDKRYRHPEVRSRILRALGEAPEGPRARFIAPASHPQYLAEVGRLTAVIDTFPYSGGLTTMEALTLGVPCFAREGRLFCERHTWAHCRYAGLPEKQFSIAPGWDAEAALASLPPRGGSLVPPGSPRTDHESLAGALLKVIES